MDKTHVYRISSHIGGVIQTIRTNPVTWEQAEAIAIKHVPKLDETRHYVIQEICTADEWEEGAVNFCPRCGSKPFVDRFGDFDCDCGATGNITMSLLSVDES
ncbi:hypothetical protein ACEF06_23730 [Brevibacillus agri]